MFSDEGTQIKLPDCSWITFFTLVYMSSTESPSTTAAGEAHCHNNSIRMYNENMVERTSEELGKLLLDSASLLEYLSTNVHTILGLCIPVGTTCSQHLTSGC